VALLPNEPGATTPWSRGAEYSAAKRVGEDRARRAGALAASKPTCRPRQMRGVRRRAEGSLRCCLPGHRRHRGRSWSPRYRRWGFVSHEHLQGPGLRAPVPPLLLGPRQPSLLRASRAVHTSRSARGSCSPRPFILDVRVEGNGLLAATHSSPGFIRGVDQVLDVAAGVAFRPGVQLPGAPLGLFAGRVARDLPPAEERHRHHAERAFLHRHLRLVPQRSRC
jgi:hypothetical protein